MRTWLLRCSTSLVAPVVHGAGGLALAGALAGGGGGGGSGMGGLAATHGRAPRSSAAGASTGGAAPAGAGGGAGAAKHGQHGSISHR